MKDTNAEVTREYKMTHCCIDLLTLRRASRTNVAIAPHGREEIERALTKRTRGGTRAQKGFFE